MSSKNSATPAPGGVLTPQEAIQKYEQAVAAQPTASDYLELGVAYYIAKRWDDALRAFQKAVEVDPRQGFAYYYIGILSAAMGNREQAMQALNRVIEVSNNQMLKDQARARIPNITSLAQLGV